MNLESKDPSGSGRLTSRLLLSLGLGAFLLGFSLAGGHGRLADGPKHSQSLGAAQFIGEAPFMEASRMPNIASAESALGWHIPRPSLCAANDGIVSGTYVNVVNGQAFIRYAEVGEGCPGFTGGHVELVASRPSPEEVLVLTPSELLAEFERQASAMGAIASVSSVGDLPVLAVRGNYSGDCDRPLPGQEGCSPPQSNRAAARVYVQGIEVEVYGDPDWNAIQILSLVGTLS